MKIPFCRIGRTSGSNEYDVNTVLDMDFSDYIDNQDSSIFATSSSGGIERITVLRNGWYLINCCEYVQRSQDGRIQASVNVSGNREYVYALKYINSGASNSVMLQYLVHLNANSWVSPEMWGDGGGTIKMIAGNGRENHLTLFCMSLD